MTTTTLRCRRLGTSLFADTQAPFKGTIKIRPRWLRRYGGKDGFVVPTGGPIRHVAVAAVAAMKELEWT
jgi:hypothetical protein